MPKCQMEILDEVNVQFHNMDVADRRRVHNRMKWHKPNAEHTPKYKLGYWDGKVAFFSIAGRTFVNLLDMVMPLVKDLGYAIETVDRRTASDLLFDPVDDTMFSGVVWPKGHTAAGQPVVIRDYQIAVVNKFLENPQSVQEIATGAGKTLLCAALVSKVAETLEQHHDDAGNAMTLTLTIVPSISLVEQTAAEYRNLGLDVGTYRSGTDEKLQDVGACHVVSTWQTLKSLLDNDKAAGREALADFARLGCVIVDEVHTAKNPDGVLRELLCQTVLKYAPVRWGLTGTFPDEEKIYEVTIKAGIGSTVGWLTARQLMDMGILSKCKVEIVRLDDSGYSFPSYHEEYDYLVSDEKRLAWMSKLVAEVAASGGNTLILVNRVATGNMIESLVPGAVFVSGSMKAKERQKHYDEVDDRDDKIIVATYGVASTGINIPRIFNLVLIEAGKSDIRVIQSIGRGIRKARDRDFAAIWDVTSTCRFAARHLKKRLATYDRAQYPYEVHDVKWKAK